MKKALAIIVISLLCQVAFCRNDTDILIEDAESETAIQNTFWGISFGDSYSIAKNTMLTKGLINYADTPFELEYFDVRFGGYKWHFCILKFDGCGRFYEIEFSQNYSDENSCNVRHDDLGRALIEKYGMPSYLGKTIGFIDDINCCMLSKSYSESQGGEMFYYNTLTYYNIELSDADNEL